MNLFGKRHSRLKDNDAHGIVWKSVANAAARLALSLDRNWLVVHQQDNDTLWVVVDKDVPTWVEITAAGAAAVTSVFGRTGDVIAQTGDYSKTNVGLGNVENLKVNLAGAADPGVGDDTLDGYSIGSLWINTTADTAWICLDATAGAAVWKDTTATGGMGGGDVSFTGGAIVDNQIARYDTNGFQIQGGTSFPTIDDGGNITSPGGIECNDLQVNGDAQIDGELAVSTVFNVDATGIQVLTGDIAVVGTVDGVDVAQLKSDFDTHDGGTSGHPNFSTSAATAGFAPGSNGQTTYFLRGDATWQPAPAGGSAVSVYDEGVQLTAGVTKFDFQGTGVTVTEPVANEVLVTIAGGAAPVSSVFSRTGAVVAATSDYDAIQIDNTPAGNIVATNVQAAINELDTEKAATGHNHDAAYAPLAHVGAGGTAHANVIAAGAAGFMTGADKTKLDGIEAGATAAGSTGDAYATSHESDSTAHDASEIVNTPAGNIVATTVQAAINELDGDKASTALFSTSSTTAGLAPGSNSVGASYFLSGAGTWLQPAGTGGGDATPRLRAQATAVDSILKDVLITGAGGTPNIDATLLDYTGLTFEDDVEIYINGKLMRGGPTSGANFDVYPSAEPGEISVGAFYCEFPLTSGDVIQMFYGGGATFGGVHTLDDLNTAIVDATFGGLAVGDFPQIVSTVNGPGLPVLDGSNLTDVPATVASEVGPGVFIYDANGDPDFLDSDTPSANLPLLSSDTAAPQFAVLPPASISSTGGSSGQVLSWGSPPVWAAPTTTAVALNTTGGDVDINNAGLPAVGDVLTATSTTTATWGNTFYPIGIRKTGGVVLIDQTAPSNGQVLQATGTGNAAWTTPSAGGGPNYAFSYTQVADGTAAASMSAGQWCVSTGSSATPSGITGLRFHITDLDGDSQTLLLAALAPGNWIRIWKATDSTEWYIYRVTLASTGESSSTHTFSVSHVGNSGGTLDQANNWNFHIYSGAGIRLITGCSSHTFDPANSNWHTYNALGLGSTAFDRDLSTATVSTALTNISYKFLGFLAPVAGQILGIDVAGYSETSSNTISYRVVRSNAAGTNADCTGFSDSFVLGTTGITGYSLACVSNLTLAQWDKFGFMLNTSGTGASYFTVTYRMLAGV